MDARRALAVTLNILAYAFRIAGIALCAIVIALCFAGIVSQLGLVDFIVDLSRALPGAIAGYGVIASPFGGVFRLDFALVAAACFGLDLLCSWASRRLRG